MDSAEVTEVCRLCPSNVAGQTLFGVFDERLSVKNNMQEVILVTTGIEILESDLVSKKICPRCCNITLKMFQFRQDALKQDRKLKEKCGEYLGDKGIRLPNSCITVKQEKTDELYSRKQIIKDYPLNAQSSSSRPDLKERLHPSIMQLYHNYPDIKLPKSCVDRHMAPVVSLSMGQVERYFKERKLDMKKFIYKQRAKNSNTPGKVAKKRTGGGLKTAKKVAPLKISKQIFGVNKLSRDGNSYVCVPVKKSRKLSVSSLESENKLKTMKLQENHDVPKAHSSKSDDKTELEQENIPESNLSKLEPPSEENETILESQMALANTNNFESHSDEESRDTNISAASQFSSDRAADFLDSFGLTPTVTATKTQTVLMCNLCNSSYKNSFELKRHTVKHMVCQFCKRKCKSLEAKQHHIDNTCEIAKIMRSPDPEVFLERIHENMEIRKKYTNAFSSFEPIPGLFPPEPVEEVTVRAVSPPVSPNSSNIIVLSDDDDDELVSPDPLSGIPTPAARMIAPAVEPLIYNTVSIVKPDLRIKHDNIVIPSHTNTKKFILDLSKMQKNTEKKTVGKMLQTEFPGNKDIRINHSEGTCEFTNLREQLTVYKVPVNLTPGPFHVNYKFNSPAKAPNKAGSWKTLNLRDKNKPKTTATSSAMGQPPPQRSPLTSAGNKSASNNQVNLVSTSSVDNKSDKRKPNTTTSSRQNSALQIPPPVPSNVVLQNTSVSAVQTNSLTTVSTASQVYPPVQSNQLQNNNPILQVTSSSGSGANDEDVQFISVSSQQSSSQTVNGVISNTSNSATPLLQNYAYSLLSMSANNNVQQNVVPSNSGYRPPASNFRDPGQVVLNRAISRPQRLFPRTPTSVVTTKPLNRPPSSNKLADNKKQLRIIPVTSNNSNLNPLNPSSMIRVNAPNLFACITGQTSQPQQATSNNSTPNSPLVISGSNLLVTPQSQMQLATSTPQSQMQLAASNNFTPNTSLIRPNNTLQSQTSISNCNAKTQPTSSSNFRPIAPSVQSSNTLQAPTSVNYSNNRTQLPQNPSLVQSSSASQVQTSVNSKPRTNPSQHSSLVQSTNALQAQASVNNSNAKKQPSQNQNVASTNLGPNSSLLPSNNTLQTQPSVNSPNPRTQPAQNQPVTSNAATPNTSNDSSKFRVKNVWELQ